MTTERLLQRLSRKVHPATLLVTAAGTLVGMNVVRVQLRHEAEGLQVEQSRLESAAEDASGALEEIASLKEWKDRDLARFKKGLTKLTLHRRELYESGLQLQDEYRQLGKVWEVMSTYLLIDEEAKKVRVMRGDQALVSYPYNHEPPEAFGQETGKVPPVVQIVSKERFAHPERGKYEEVNGQLQWEPPQVGTSMRANALGEYVMFTRSPLILHGSPKRAAEHKAFAHVCLGLPLAVARRLYEASYIGTKIILKPAPAPKPGLELKVEPASLSTAPAGPGR